MALIYCSECGNSISEFAVVCVKCGNPINEQKTQESEIIDFNSIDKNYSIEFEKIHNSNGKYKGKFNFYAFFFGAIWFFVKGCWATGLAYILIAILSILFNQQGVKIITLFICVHGAVRGNYILYNKKVLNKDLWL